MIKKVREVKKVVCCRSAFTSLADIEQRHIEATLRSTEWNKSKTSENLGIERSALDRKIKRYELKRPS